ncbi:T9SS type A sorting domain-containing protein [Pseudochryseolinea flava]|uniref:Secretion system C-terminal sorting domain-containing protein n=1 Tax=Pseudochryseolinea flava TaxID=2059302 RepID=A0A364XVC4_9BACT|nr:T9SS type A sorting domain-containing protein [Pseudochryseolinea flava]RAV98060.1 hypothetical protein DQQ10_25335 [Pseudochryseolinea flava]
MHFNIKNTIATTGKALHRHALVLMLMLLATSLGYTQIKVSPIERIPPTTASTPLSNARIKSVTLQLPFFEDFSTTPVDDPTNPESNFPLKSRWMKSSSTAITSATGINLPSINAAVFDGLDSTGRAYSSNQDANGYRDVLTSQLIDLGPVAVSNGERSTVLFTFYYQFAGNGEAPDKNDFLRLEFLNVDSVWKEVATIYPETIDAVNVFYDTTISVNQDVNFFHNEFQFRFRSFGGLQGPVDTWMVDHIYLNKGRLSVDEKPEDIALSAPLTPLFGRYYSVPVGVFKLTKEKFSPITVAMQNLQDVAENRKVVATAAVKNYSDEVLEESYSYGPLEAASVNFLPFERKEASIPDNFIEESSVIDTSDWVDFDVTVWLDAFNTTTSEIDEPLRYRVNDTLRTHYRLHNYYAYDDGSAEYSVELAQPGNRILYQFDIDSTQLRRFAGFDIFVPAFTVTDESRIDFIFYDHDTEKNGPGEAIYTMPSKVIARTPLNKFQRFTIPEGEEVQLEIKDKIYIGWVHPTFGKFNVGVDRSNNTVDKVFVAKGGEWFHTDKFVGSIMIRPLFGTGVRIPTGVEEDLTNVPLYPNPSRGEFFTDVRTEVTGIINLAGQAVPFSNEFFQDQRKITLQSPARGLYLVKLKNGSKVFVRKMLVE